MDGLPWNTHKCHGVANHQQQLLQPDWAGGGRGGGYILASVQDVAETLNQINVMSISMGPKVMQTL